MLSLFLFSFAILVTPGPNNIVLLTTSINYGIKETIPNLLGIWFGFGLLIIIGTSSLGFFINETPFLLIGLKIFGFVYILYLAYKIFKNNSFDAENKKPINFFESTLLKISNPKGLILIFAIVTNFWMVNESYLYNLLYLIFFLISVSVVSNLIWVALGVIMKRKLSNNFLSIFNKFMALVLVLTTFYSYAVTI